MKKLVLVIALLLVIPVTLVGCGKSDKAAIEDSIEGFVDAYNDENYEKCTDYLLGITDATKDATKAGLEVARGISGEIEVTSIEDISVDEDSATAKVTVKVMGQTQTNTVSFTKADGKWKFDMTGLLG
ncbi:MAG: hypothetical protein JW753_10765 [Dehalococcoidia bacterium]|nr:hypothetical protein [Dehalococcoidia bacterium]